MEFVYEAESMRFMIIVKATEDSEKGVMPRSYTCS